MNVFHGATFRNYDLQWENNYKCIYMYAGIMNYVTFVQALRNKNQLACRCVFICHHRTLEALFVWVDMQIRVKTRVNT